MDYGYYDKFPSEELTKQYSPSAWSRRMSADSVIKHHCEVTLKASQSTQSLISCSLDVSYGSGTRQKFNIFHPKIIHAKESPIVGFIHGGYWQQMNKNHYDFIAKPLTDAGVTFVSMGYDLKPEATLPQMVRSIHMGLSQLIKKYGNNNIRSLYLVGHSAGAQLAFLAMCRSQTGEEYSHYVKGVMLISGVYDLRPLVNTYVNDALSLSMAEAWEESPLNPYNISSFIEKHSHCSVHIAVGEYDSPEFNRQSADLHKVLINSNHKLCFLKQVPGVDHFDIIENLASSDFTLTKELLEMIEKTKS